MSVKSNFDPAEPERNKSSYFESSRNKSSYITLVFCTLATVGILLILAFQSRWRYHLEVDIWGFYYPRFSYFLENLSFGKFGDNEYMPGAMFSFLIPGIALVILPNTWQNYLIGLFAINIILIVCHLFIYRKISQVSPFIFLAIILAAGPIVLYRHDLFVSLFLLISLILWKSKKSMLAPFFLGIAASIKIFPVLILPYFLLSQTAEQESRKIFKITITFLIGLFSILGLYLLTGARIGEILATLNYNATKPVHIESLWGSLLTLINAGVDGTWPRGLGDRGIFGIHPQDIFLPLTFYNYFWLVPMSFFYFKIYRNFKNQESVFPVAFLIILLFIIFSKILTPQYLFWFATLFPLLNFYKIPSKLNAAPILIMIAALLLTQFIYPLHYNELLGIFYTSGQRAEFFFILLSRNLLLVILFFIIYQYVQKIAKNQ